MDYWVKTSIANQKQKYGRSFAKDGHGRAISYMKRKKLTQTIIFNSKYIINFARASVSMRLLLP